MKMAYNNFKLRSLHHLPPQKNIRENECPFTPVECTPLDGNFSVRPKRAGVIVTG